MSKKTEEKKIEAPKVKVLRVAKGKSVVAKGKVLRPGQEVNPEHIGGGQEAVSALLKRGYLVKE